MWYIKTMKILGLALLALMASAPACAGERSVETRPRTCVLRVIYNGESLRAWYLLIDARSPAEREKDAKTGALGGPVIVFFQGHAQRPSDAYAFSSELALGCRSGIVVVPVSDTPYGADERLRGDRGKEAVLMAVVRTALASRGIGVRGLPPDDGEVRVLSEDAVPDPAAYAVSARLIAVGWSHGGILARRIAHAYPGAVTALGQVCPAGYEPGGPLSLTGRFVLESVRISKLFAGGGAGDALMSAWGFTKGVAGDFARSVAGAVVHRHPAKILRVGRDIRDCSLYCDDGNFGVGLIERVGVIFGAADTCMSPQRILGATCAAGVEQETAQRFWERYYPEALSAGAALSLEVLPGTHLAPVTHSRLYAERLLRNLGEKADFSEGEGEERL